MRVIKLNTQTVIVSIVSALFLSACGSSSSETPTTGTEVVACDAGSTALKKDDKVVALTAGTELQILHKQDGTKSVCVVTGEAEVI